MTDELENRVDALETKINEIGSTSEPQTQEDEAAIFSLINVVILVLVFGVGGYFVYQHYFTPQVKSAFSNALNTNKQ